VSTLEAIRAFDYVEQYQAIQEEILDAVRDVLASGTLILGPWVERFERNFAAYLERDGQAVGVGNGTDALAIALKALRIKPGDEVITVANTAIPTVSAIRMAGATPVFCEIDADTLLMDVSDLERRITPRTRAVMPVHLFGNAVDMPAVMRVARRHGLAVVEDCAQSCGTTWEGQHTGTFGDVGCFSFYPTKNLGAYGDGGMCFTRRPEIAEAMRQLRTYGCSERYDCRREGVNSRLDELQAAILDVKLRHLPGYLAARRRVAAIYDQQLAREVWRPGAAPQADPSYHLFVIATSQRDRLVERLDAAGIGYGIHYPRPIHCQAGYEFLNCRRGTLPITERMAEQILSLPCYPELPHDAVRAASQVVNDVATTLG
jgi:aminotransferase EvaB